MTIPKSPKTLGFTLIELLVVISIISLLSSIVLSSLSSARAKARDVKRVQESKQFVNALELYRNDNSAYYNTSGSGITPDTIPGIQNYIKTIPTNVQEYVSSGGSFYGLKLYFEDKTKYNTDTNGNCLYCGTTDQTTCKNTSWWNLGTNYCKF
jgi:prepilin-type N-terminal cleavage/methylation domain-containing protein